jgi:hypothetical protein
MPWISEAESRLLDTLSSDQPPAQDATRTPQIIENAFTQWTRDRVHKLILANVDRLYTRARRMLDGDHWQESWGWIGPRPAPDDDFTTSQMAWNELQQGFVSRNVIAEVVSRENDAVTADAPQWALVPIDPDKAEDASIQLLIKEATNGLTRWWQRRGLDALLSEFVETLLLPGGRSALRPFIPKGLTFDTNGVRTISARGLEDALAKVFVEHVWPTRSLLYVDPDTQREIGICVFTPTKDGTPDVNQDSIEISFVNADTDETVIITISRESGTDRVRATTVNIGGRVLLIEARRRRPFLTWQILAMQRALNFAESVVPRTIATGGFLQLMLTNASLPGEWEVDANGKRTGKFIAYATPSFGPDTVNYVSGQELTDKDGAKTLTTPGVHWHEPVDATSALNAKRSTYEDIVEEANQGHIFDRSADNANSGNSKREARSGFLKSVRRTAAPFNQCGAQLIETVLAMAEAMMGQQGRYTSVLRVDFKAHISAGPVSPEERDGYIRAFEKGVLSRETVQEAIGVDDVDAENARIAAQEGAAVDLTLRQANIYKMLTDAGVGPKEAALAAGFDEKQASAFEASAKRMFEQQMQLAKTTALAAQKQNGGRPSGNKKPGPGQGTTKSSRTLVDKKQQQRAG